MRANGSISEFTKFAVNSGGEDAGCYDAPVVVIDAHTHVFAREQVPARARIAARDATFAELYGNSTAELATPEMLIATLAQAGIDGAVMAGFAFTGTSDCREQNDAILEAARVWPQLIALATTNPGSDGWKAQAEKALADGARGFGELRPGNQQWDPLGGDANALYSMTHEAGGVLLWHVSEPLGHTYPGKRGGISPTELEAVAERWPGLRMIAAHLGGGLSFFLSMPEVRASLADVYFDTAAWRLLYDKENVAQLVASAGSGRVLFGSDYPLLSPAGELRRLRAIVPDAAEAVCGMTAETLFFGPK